MGEAGGTTGSGQERLALYGYTSCPFCARVLAVIGELGLEIPLLDTRRDAAHRQALVEAMGRATVPVLRIEGPEGEVKWLPESADIIRYLVARYG